MAPYSKNIVCQTSRTLLVFWGNLIGVKDEEMPKCSFSWIGQSSNVSPTEKIREWCSKLLRLTSVYTKVLVVCLDGYLLFAQVSPRSPSSLFRVCKNTIKGPLLDPIWPRESRNNDRRRLSMRSLEKALQMCDLHILVRIFAFIISRIRWYRFFIPSWKILRESIDNVSI